ADWEKAVGDSSWIQAEEIPEISGLSEFIVPEKEMVAESPVKNELIKEKTDTKSEESEDESIELTIEKTSANELPKQVEETKKIKEIELSETQNETLLTTSETDKSTFSNLTRNILLVFLFLIILVPTLSFLLKRKANK
ncbi:MAG: hypothetical protein GQ525_16565, partial [Draconibacterium sp.]|nr:hypothetical protein [Draconibacterium sp.]